MPGWLTSSVIYELNTATFSAAGDFASVTARLPYLDELGVNVLWLMPIHPVGKLRSKPPYGSPYAVRDYYAINPDYGTKDDLHRLIQAAHARHMRVIIDIVANHTSWDSVLMEHPDFYKHDAQGQIIPPNAGWDDVAALDYANPAVRTYMLGMLEYWVREFDLDGFRCDVAYMVPIDFWEEARTRLEKVKPDVMMLAEGQDPPLTQRAFDMDYGWPLYHALEAVMTEGAPASHIRETWEQQLPRFRPGALHMGITDDHDEQRAIAAWGLKAAMAASALMFTLDGVPLLYNGMEVGDTTESGEDALFHHLKVFWPIGKGRHEVFPFYKKLIAMRRGSRTLQTGAVEWVDTADKHLVAFKRRGDQELLIAVNLSNQPVQGSLAFGENQQLFGDPAVPSALALKPWGSAVWLRAHAL